ncbi:MAG TPA: Uma2 family endonuclease [Armatimonadota bacterium]|nr:Uma2 family endonuclease [Armatimonadota bacterium]
MTSIASRQTNETLADLIRRLGSVPPDRIAAYPPPGSASEHDLLSPRTMDRLYELVDGVLVEKAMGYYESILAGVLIQLLRNFLDVHPLGTVLGPDGMLRLAPGLIRAPDVSFISWERFPSDEAEPKPIPDLAPDLAVEILSVSNTIPEMDRKLREYFAAGSRLIWYVDAHLKPVRVYTSPTEYTDFAEDDTLDGAPVLPGFKLSVREWFSRAERQPSPA